MVALDTSYSEYRDINSTRSDDDKRGEEGIFPGDARESQPSTSLPGGQLMQQYIPYTRLDVEVVPSAIDDYL